MNSNILVYGRGWIGSRLATFLDCPSTERRINTYEDVQADIDQFSPKVIINCIGSYGKSVDDCELDKTKTFHAHVTVPLLMAEAARRNNIKLVHISSGCIFNYDYEKDNPLTEDTPPDFFKLYYSRTKIYAEAALYAMKDSCNILMVRIRMPLDYIPHRHNLLDKLISFGSVIDVENSCTYIPDFLEAVKHLLSIDATGIYNIVNYGGLKHKELLEKYREWVPNHGYAITTLNELKLVRTNILLSTDKLEETKFQVRDIHDVLHECCEKYMAIRKNPHGQKA